MFEYVNPKPDKERTKTRVLTVIVTLISAAGVFEVLYYAASSGM